MGEEYLLEEVLDEAGDRFEKHGEVYTEERIYWLSSRQGTDLWANMVCKLVSFFMHWRNG